MAKKVREVIHLFSSSKTGHFYSTTKNKRNHSDKVKLIKFDPVVRRHVLYIEGKQK